MLAGWTALALMSAARGQAQTPLVNGWTHVGTIAVGGVVDSWTFDAAVGERVVIRVGEIAQTNAFAPRLRLINPAGNQQANSAGTAAAEVSVVATNSGTFTVQVDGTVANATGVYRLTLVKAPGVPSVAPGDEGGALTNGAVHTGVIDLGDLDVWTFTATAGQSLVLRMAEATPGLSLTPALWLYGPNGALLDSYGASGAAAQVVFRATNSGTFLVVAGDFSSGYAGSGAYRLTLAKTGDPITVSPGDEGGSLTNGAMHTGTIEVGDVDLWSIEANTGDSLTVRVGELLTGALTPYVGIYGPTGVLLDFAAGSVSAEASVRATNNGTYLVLVTDLSNGYAGSGPYRLTLARTGSPVGISANDEGGPLVNGAVHTGVIDLGDLDVWTFTATAGQNFLLRMAEATPGLSLTPALWLYGPNGALLDSFGGSSVAAQVSFRATNSGTFTVVAGDFSSGYGGSGAYRLTLAETGIPFVVSPGDEGGLLTNGVMPTGTIEIGDVDLWTFDANAGDNLTVRVGESVAGGLTPYVGIYGPTGVLLDGAYGSAAAEVSVRATNSGTFLVLVTDLSNGYAGSGAYRLTLARTGSPVGISANDEGGPLVNGAVHTGVIDLGDLDVWTFSATAGQNFLLRMAEATPGLSLTPALWLYGPNGALLDSFGGSGVAAQVSFRATNSGTFTVVAGDLSSGYGGSGAYRLTLAETGIPFVISPGDEGGLLTNGVMHTGTIEIGDIDLWTFDANAGDNLTVRVGELVAGGLTPYVGIYGPTGVLLDGAYGSAAAEVSIRATNSGTFLVLVTDLSNGYAGSGAYRLTLARTGSPVGISANDEGGPLVNGTVHTGVIDLGDLDVWTFTASAGQSFLLRMAEATPGLSLTPALWLYGPNGALLDSFGGSGVAAQVSFRATNSGTFTVVAGDLSSGYGGSGAYRLTLAETGVPIVVSPGDEGGLLTNGVMHTGTIEVGDVDQWSFDASAGDSLTVRVGEMVAGGLTPWVGIYGPTGVLLDSAYGTAAAEVSVRATNSGTFLVLVADLSNGYAGSGAYRLTLARTGSPVGVSPNDEGGLFDGSATYEGNLEVGDLDVWSFTLCRGERIVMHLEEAAAGSALTPWLRLFGREGTEIRSVSGASSVHIDVTATNTGTFVVVAGDLSSGYAGSGAYRLSVNGLVHALRLCDPQIVGTNVTLSGAGGPVQGGFTIFTAPAVEDPLATWAPLLNGQFDIYGAFSRSNAAPRQDPKRFFLLRQP